MERTAEISPCGRYRMLLTRTWFAGPRALFLMLNPSRADADIDDPTATRVVGFAAREKCGGVIIANAFPYRAKDPKDLVRAGSLRLPQPESDNAIRQALAMATGPVVAAWGAHPLAKPREAVIRRLAAEANVRLLCLGKTKSGAPRHPLYLLKDTPLIDF